MDVRGIRNHMAENGIELTPNETIDVVTKIEGIKESIRNNVFEDPQCYDDLVNMSDEEKLDMIDELREAGTIMTVTELDEILDILMTMYKQEFPDGPFSM